MYNKITLLALLIFSCIGNAQNLIYQEEFDGTTSYTNDPLKVMPSVWKKARSPLKAMDLQALIRFWLPLSW